MAPGRADRRSKELRLTEAGATRLRAAIKAGARRRPASPQVFGETRTATLRSMLRAVATSEWLPPPSRDAGQRAAGTARDVS